MLQVLVNHYFFLVNLTGTPAHASPGRTNATQARNYQRGLENLTGLPMALHPIAI